MNRILILLAGPLLAAPAFLPMNSNGSGADATISCAAAERAPDARCSEVMTVAVDGKGRLWRAWVDRDRIWLQSSGDPRHGFAAPVAVNAIPEPIATGAENRPRVIFSGERVVVVWSRPGKARFTGDVRMAVSEDHGATFQPARTVNRDGLETGHAFAALSLDARDRALVFWLDGRDRHAAEASGQAFRGSSLYWSRLHESAKLGDEHRAAPGTCECCRLSTGRLPDGRAVVMWRQIFEDGARDHALGVLDDNGLRWRRASFENWRIDGCPHHGPALAVDARAGIHAVWFSGAGPEPGLYYRRFNADWIDGDSAQAAPSAPDVPVRSIGEPGHLPSHPALAVAGSTMVLAWLEILEDRQCVRVQQADTSAQHWQSPRTAACHAGRVDHPALVVVDGQVWLSWHLPGVEHRLVPMAIGS